MDVEATSKILLKTLPGVLLTQREVQGIVSFHQRIW